MLDCHGVLSLDVVRFVRLLPATTRVGQIPAFLAVTSCKSCMLLCKSFSSYKYLLGWVLFRY